MFSFIIIRKKESPYEMGKNSLLGINAIFVCFDKPWSTKYQEN